MDTLTKNLQIMFRQADYYVHMHVSCSFSIGRGEFPEALVLPENNTGWVLMAPVFQMPHNKYLPVHGAGYHAGSPVSRYSLAPH